MTGSGGLWRDAQALSPLPFCVRFDFYTNEPGQQPRLPAPAFVAKWTPGLGQPPTAANPTRNPFLVSCSLRGCWGQRPPGQMALTLQEGPLPHISTFLCLGPSMALQRVPRATEFSTSLPPQLVGAHTLPQPPKSRHWC